jgi:hypothetical protein
MKRPNIERPTHVIFCRCTQSGEVTAELQARDRGIRRAVCPTGHEIVATYKLPTGRREPFTLDNLLAFAFAAGVESQRLEPSAKRVRLNGRCLRRCPYV